MSPTKLLVVALAVLLALALVSGLLLTRGSGGAEPSIQVASLSSAQCEGSSCVLFFQAEVPSYARQGGAGTFSNLIEVANPTSTDHTVESVTVFGVSGVAAGAVSLDFYYYTSVSQFNPDGTPAQTPVGSCQVTTYSGCDLFEGSQLLRPGADQYLVVIAQVQAGSPLPPTAFYVSLKWS